MNIKMDSEVIKKTEEFNLKTNSHNDSLNEKAIFSDETIEFRTSLESERGEVTKIKLRTARNNVDSVFILCDGVKLETVKLYSEGIFDFYEGYIKLKDRKIDYYFEIHKNNEIFFYNKLGVSCEIALSYNFKIVPDFKTPNWAKGAIMYQIYVDRFYDGDKNNNVCDNEYIYLGKPSVYVDDWNKYPECDDIRNFYGGDLKGVIDKLNYISELGIEVIYFNPIFVSPSNHKYDTQDYDYVDPHIGVIVEEGGENLIQGNFYNKYASKYAQRTTNKVNLEASNKLMETLIHKAHSKGIKVILDGVFNHCGAFNKWLDREGLYSNVLNYPVGAYKQKDSPYNNYFVWYDSENWPNNDCYDGWWGMDNHPKLNYERSKELYDYILKVGVKWVSPPYNADGWRLDVASDLGKSLEFNHKFWKDFRNCVKTANPEAVIIAENYGDSSSWLEGGEWDSIMNYDAFMEPITWFLTGMEKHSDEFNPDLLCNADAFISAMKYHMSKLSIQSMQIAMNELSNHDHSRFLTRTNMTPGRVNTHGSEAAGVNINKGIMKEAITFQMTWPGSPTIYYGDEAGLVGWTDPDDRRTYPWGLEDRDILEYHRVTIAIHKRYSALKIGSVEYLECSHGILSYGRFDQKDKLIIALNNNNEERIVSISAWRIGISIKSNVRRLILSTKEGFDTERKYYTVDDGMLEITLPAYSSAILVEENSI